MSTIYHFIAASEAFLTEEEPLEEVLRERTRHYQEAGKPIDFWLVRRPAFLESREIAAGGSADAGSPETVYYLHWLAALERLVADKGLASVAALARRKAEWREAYDATAHGQPVVLGAKHRHDHNHHH